MGLWAKSVVLFNSIRDHGKQSIRCLADRTGLSKSSVHRHLQARDRRDRYPGNLGQFLEPFSIGNALLLCHQAFDTLQAPDAIPAHGIRQLMP
jgi:hypothetical protein